MFGRQKKDTHGEEARVPVNAVLEGNIGRVEQVVADYLADPTARTLHSLVAALKELDDQTDQSDAYESSVIGSAALGYASKGEVIGETGLESVVDEVPSAEFNAQFALVKAAKDEVRDPGPETFASLRSASAALARARNHGEAGP
jgi:hypothetical protein